MPIVKYPGLKKWLAEQLKTIDDKYFLYREAQLNYNYEDTYKKFCEYLWDTKRYYKDYIKNPPEINEDNPNDTLELRFEKQLNRNYYINIFDLCEDLKCYPRQIEELINIKRQEGKEIIWQDNNIFLAKNVTKDEKPLERLSDDKEIIFGVASDLHFGSKAVQITALHKFCHECEKQDVKYIFMPGDLTTGYRVYPGHEIDVYAYTSEEQEKSVAANLPSGDYQWIMLGGNHDFSFISKGGGHNPLRSLLNMRKDVYYVGYDTADVPLMKNVDLRMWHPSGGVPYAMSHRLQKGIEQMAFEELKKISMNKKDTPTLRFVICGHLHIQLQAMFGSIFGIQAGCFEGTTNYLKRKGLYPAIGGWIIKATLGKNNKLNDFDSKFYLYDEVIDDWKNFNHNFIESHEKNQFKKPLFT